MAGEYSGTVAESGGGYELLGMLKNLGREEILEVFSGGEGFCQHCKDVLQSRIKNIINKKTGELSVSCGNSRSSSDFWSGNSFSLSSETNAKSSSENTFSSMLRTPERVNSGLRKGFVNPSPASVNTQKPSFHGTSKVSVNVGFSRVASPADIRLLDDREEYNRFAQISRKKDYSHIEKINGKATNVLRGLELHKNVFSSEEQKKIVESVYNLQRMGQNGQLRERTYSEPKKWMRGKGRVTIQFGCCYNYAVDKHGNPPGIVRDEEVDPLPPLFKQMIKRMIRMHVLPSTCVPNSCIVNIYDEGDCIPPHIDHHDFLRPFCTISFLTECNILFGTNLTIVNAGEFAGPVSIPLPVGSVLVLNGNGADIAKHCVPAVPARRISITFRRMDDSKIPYNFPSDPELMGLKPLVYSTSTKSPVQQNQQENGLKITHHEAAINMAKASNTSIFSEKDDFPPLGNSHPVNSSRTSGNGWRR